MGPLIAPLVSRAGQLGLDVVQSNLPGRKGVAPVRMFGSERPAVGEEGQDNIHINQLIGLITGSTPYAITPGSAAATYMPKEKQDRLNAEYLQRELQKLLNKAALEVEKQKLKQNSQ